MGRPIRHGAVGLELLSARVCRRLFAHLPVFDPAWLAAGAGLRTHRGWIHRLDPPPHPALDRTRPRLRRAHRSNHARGHAGCAVRGLHPHRARQGVATGPVLMKHALKNAGVPIVTVIGVGVALLIGGVVITETVFNIPGVGRLVVDAISQRDYPIIQGVTLIFSAVYVIVNLIVDLSYTLLDPRIRY